MKVILSVILAITFNSTTFSQSGNYEFCKEKVISKKDKAVKTAFSLNHELTNEEFQLLEEHLFPKINIYDLTVNSGRTRIFVYHLNHLNVEEIKLLLLETNIELSFLFTKKIEFRHESNSNLEIER